MLDLQQLGSPYRTSSGPVARTGCYILAFLAITLFYSATAPENLSESNDAYWYADVVENARLDQLEDSRSPLFFLTGKLAYLLAQSLYADVSGLQVLWWLNVLCASASVVLLYVYLRKPGACSPAAAAFGAAMLGLSYGFWRYASVPELYAPSALLILLALHAIAAAAPLAEDGGRREWIGRAPLLGALYGLAVLFYRPICIVLFIVWPLAVLRPRRIPALVLYGAAGTLVVLIGYVVLFVTTQQGALTPENLAGYVFSRSAEFTGNDFATSTIVGGIAAFLRMIAAGQWVLGFEFVRDWLAATIPEKGAPNELYQAVRAGLLPYAALAILVPLVVAFASVVAVAVRNRQETGSGRTATLFVVWSAIYFAFAFYLAPFAYEVYILILPPLAGLAAIWLGEPVAASGRQWLLAIAAVLFGAFNWVGGLAVVDGADSDYVRHRAEWLAANARPGDLVVVARKNNWETMTYLRYVTGATVVIVDQPDVGAMVQSTLAGGGRVFAFGDLVQGSTAAQPAQVGALVEGWRPRSRLVHETDAGRTFEIAPGGAAR